jgi:hypothetical protein
MPKYSPFLPIQRAADGINRNMPGNRCTARRPCHSTPKQRPRIGLISVDTNIIAPAYPRPMHISSWALSAASAHLVHPADSFIGAGKLLFLTHRQIVVRFIP